MHVMVDQEAAHTSAEPVAHNILEAEHAELAVAVPVHAALGMSADGCCAASRH